MLKHSNNTHFLKTDLHIEAMKEKIQYFITSLSGPSLLLLSIYISDFCVVMILVDISFFLFLSLDFFSVVTLF